MPVRKGTLGYESKLARAKAKRAINRLQKIVDSNATRDEKAAARASIYAFQREVKATYQPKGKLTAKQRTVIEEANARVSSLAESARIATGKYGAANLHTQWEINEASKKRELGEQNPSRYTKAQVKVFYKVTQRIWQNTDGSPTNMHDVNKRIMKYFGTQSLETAFERALSSEAAKKALAVAQAEEDGLGSLTEEERALYEEAGYGDNEDSDKGSPSYLTGLVQFDPDIPWNKQEM